MAEIINLGRSCTLTEVERLRQTILDELALLPAGELRLNATGIEDADISVVQILLAARNSAASRGLRFSVDPSPLVRKLCRDAGLPSLTTASCI